MKEFKIAVLPGDGIGPEIVPEAIKVLNKVGQIYGFSFDYEEALVGGAAIDAVGEPLPKATLDLCKRSDAILLGAVGGPKWDNLPAEQRPEAGALLPLRKELGLYANIRPSVVYEELANASTLKKAVVAGTDLLTIRELTGGIYFGAKYRGEDEKGKFAVDENKYYVGEIERICRLAFEIARTRRKKVTSVDKANVLETSRLWRETVIALHEKEFSDVRLDHLYVDNAAMQLILRPTSFDVMVTENMFGDILTDQASVLTGSIGMLGSASIGGKVALYEPAHGSAPDIAGLGKANPLATILSGAMMLKYSFKEIEAAEKIEHAVKKVLAAGYRTPDIMEKGKMLVTTSQMGDLVLEAL
ncbi:MAG: 3-isopropylmalate dehydrogenase [Firmicutes bacterium]|nr:3-isopropylmalate dehydrogenase [Bacillota bacterium]